MVRAHERATCWRRLLTNRATHLHAELRNVASSAMRFAAPVAAIAEASSSLLSLRRLWNERNAEQACETVAVMNALVDRYVQHAEDELAFLDDHVHHLPVSGKLRDVDTAGSYESSSLYHKMQEHPASATHDGSAFQWFHDDMQHDPLHLTEPRKDELYPTTSSAVKREKYHRLPLPHAGSIAMQRNGFRAVKAWLFQRARVVPEEVENRLRCTMQQRFDTFWEHLKYRLYVNGVKGPSIIAGAGGG